MLLVDRTQQIIVLILVACSGWLLGIGQQNSGISILAVSAAILSFVFNDWLQWVRFNRWVANVVALAVTAVALRGFFHADSPNQLFMIANLLIYLQIVLLFQVKTPRVYWQILVLSLLQIVVAAAFHISLEGGIVFFCYLLISGVAMVILQVHSQTHRIRIANRRTVNTIRSSQAMSPTQVGPLIVAMHDQIYPNRRPLTAMVRQAFAVGVVSIAFAVVTFYLIPRDEIIWTGSQTVSDPQPGYSRMMDLEEDVQIYLSSEVVMETIYFSPSLKRQIELLEPPYLRGMPLADLIINGNNQTRWRAQIDASGPGASVPMPGIWTRDFLIQTIKLEPTSDPLLHTMYPAMRLPNTPADMEWSIPLSLLCRSDVLTSNTDSYEYDLAIPVLANQRQFEAFSHHAVHATSLQRLETRADEFARTTYLDRTRYPGLIQLAEQQAAGVANRSDAIQVARTLENYLAVAGGYRYTLDFRNINWDNQLDHIEDFVVNKRRGHCEFFASALVLMLRSQGIPSRVVVGFHGGDFDQDTNAYIVRKRNAHAWVEAYFRPEQCPRSWFGTGQASGAGAWLRLDPTPAVPAEELNATTPLVAAKDFWNTYVMGLNSAKQRDSAFQSFVQNPFRNIAQLFSLRYWRIQWETFVTKGQWYKSSVTYLLGGIACIVFVSLLNKWLRRNRRSQSLSHIAARSTSLKRILGRALALVAPRLGRWVAGDDRSAPEVAFYQRFQRIMQRHGQSRLSFQTAREFAQSAEEFFAKHSQAAAIRANIESVVDKFYWVRFSQRDLTAEEVQQVESSLAFLEQNLTPIPSAS